MGINIYFLADHLISLLVHGSLPVVGKVLCGFLGFSGLLIYLAGIGYLVVRKDRESSHLLALKTPDCSASASGYGQTRQDIASMQLPQTRNNDH